MLSCGFKIQKALTGGASEELNSISTLATDFYGFVGNSIPPLCLSFSVFPQKILGKSTSDEMLLRYLRLNNIHSDLVLS